MDLRHHPSGLAHLDQLVRVPSHTGQPTFFPRRCSITLTIRRVTASGDPVPGTVSSWFRPVPLDERGGLALVQLQPALDGLLGVVLTLDHLTAADVTRPVDERGGRERVVGPAVDADPAGGQPAQDLAGVDLDVDGQVQVVGGQHRGQLFGLGHRPGAPVEDEPPGPDVALPQPFGHHLHDQVVPQQLSTVHLVLGLESDGRPLLDSGRAACPRSRRGAPHSGARGARTVSPSLPPVCRGQ